MKKICITGLICLLGLLGLMAVELVKFSDSRLHVVFCSVGQGDAILIRTPSGKTILVDGGPDRAVLDCLSRHMPFWQRKIDMIILSHPHLDHLAGLVDVVKLYSTMYFATEKLDNATLAYQALKAELEKRHVPQRYLFTGDSFRLADGFSIRVLGPSRAYLQTTSPRGQIAETKEFASLVSELSLGTFSVLLTGDSQTSGLQRAMRSLKNKPVILQIPHHGSKYGLDMKTIRLLRPKLAVISVGKNTYGHPSREVLTICSQEDIQVLRTDQHGDIELISDGKRWEVIPQNH